MILIGVMKNLYIMVILRYNYSISIIQIKDEIKWRQIRTNYVKYSW